MNPRDGAAVTRAPAENEEIQLRNPPTTTPIMATGNGKIANLPAEIREKLNWRINDGEPGNEIVEWLNSLPEVMEVTGARFNGIPISEQNLSEWRKRGYQQWLTLHIILDESDASSKNAEQIAESGIDCEKLLLILTGSYAEMIRRWNITPMDEMAYKMSIFKDLTSTVLALRRAEMQKVRLEIDRARLDLLREKQRNKSASSSASAPSSSADPASAASAVQSEPASALESGSPQTAHAASNGNSPESAPPTPAAPTDLAGVEVGPPPTSHPTSTSEAPRTHSVAARALDPICVSLNTAPQSTTGAPPAN